MLRWGGKKRPEKIKHGIKKKNKYFQRVKSPLPAHV